MHNYIPAPRRGRQKNQGFKVFLIYNEFQTNLDQRSPCLKKQRINVTVTWKLLAAAFASSTQALQSRGTVLTSTADGSGELHISLLRVPSIHHCDSSQSGLSCSTPATLRPRHHNRHWHLFAQIHFQHEIMICWIRE